MSELIYCALKYGSYFQEKVFGLFLCRTFVALPSVIEHSFHLAPQKVKTIHEKNIF